MANNNQNNVILNIFLFIIVIFLIQIFFGKNRNEKFMSNNNEEYEYDAEIEAEIEQANNNSQQNNKKYSCNLLGLNEATMSEYMKEYYPTYKHQIACPKKCGLSSTGYACSQPADPIKMNIEAMTMANNKPCVTCTENSNAKYSNLPQNTINQDQERLNMKKTGFDNMNSYVDFNNVTFQDSISGPTQVDKLAVMRTAVDGTCDLAQYGTQISKVYDGLIGKSYKQKEKITQPLTGFYNGNAEGNIYAQPLTHITN